MALARWPENYLQARRLPLTLTAGAMLARSHDVIAVARWQEDLGIQGGEMHVSAC